MRAGQMCGDVGEQQQEETSIETVGYKWDQSYSAILGGHEWMSQTGYS